MTHIPDLSQQEASAIIVEVEQKQFNGTLRTNKRSAPCRFCKKCGTKFESKNFNYCPICAVHDATNFDLRDTINKRIPQSLSPAVHKYTTNRQVYKKALKVSIIFLIVTYILLRIFAS